MSKWWKEEPVIFFLGRMCGKEMQRKKGGKKEGKSAGREAVIEAIKHW